MQELRFIGADDAALIVSDEAGGQYRVIVDDALRDALRPKPHVRSEAPKVPPREIQQLIRAGNTVDQVVEATGADRDYIERFEGPVMAERTHIVEQAGLVKVRVQPDADPLDPDAATFGTVIAERLESLGAASVTWDAWKDPEEGWRVGLVFSVDGIDRDALWSFDPRSRALAPLNPSAVTLSQQGELSSLQAPRLRAVESTPVPDLSDTQPAEPEPPAGQAAQIPARATDPRGQAWLGAAVADIGQQRGDAPRDETADLLEQLRRRRGERAPQSFDDVDEPVDDIDLDASPDASSNAPDDSRPAARDASSAAPTTVTPFSRARDRAVTAHPSTASEHDRIAAVLDSDDAAGAPHDDGSGGIHAVDVPLEGLEAPDARANPGARGAAAPHADDAARFGGRGATGSVPRNTTGPLTRKRGRASLPSWDEIVFGTRSDDDRD